MGNQAGAEHTNFIKTVRTSAGPAVPREPGSPKLIGNA